MVLSAFNSFSVIKRSALSSEDEWVIALIATCMETLQLSGAPLSVRPSILLSSPSVRAHTFPRILTEEQSPPALGNITKGRRRRFLCVCVCVCMCVCVFLTLCGHGEGFLELCLDICNSSVCLVVAFVLDATGGEGSSKTLMTHCCAMDVQPQKYRY